MAKSNYNYEKRQKELKKKKKKEEKRKKKEAAANAKKAAESGNALGTNPEAANSETDASSQD